MQFLCILTFCSDWSEAGSEMVRYGGPQCHPAREYYSENPGLLSREFGIFSESPGSFSESPGSLCENPIPGSS